MVWLLQLAPVPSSGVAADDDGGGAVGAAGYDGGAIDAAGYDVRCEYNPTLVTAPSVPHWCCIMLFFCFLRLCMWMNQHSRVPLFSIMYLYIGLCISTVFVMMYLCSKLFYPIVACFKYLRIAWRSLSGINTIRC